MTKLNLALSKKLPEFTLSGDYLFLNNPACIAAGVFLEETPSAYSLILWQLPLFQKWEFLHTAFSEMVVLSEKPCSIADVLELARVLCESKISELKLLTGTTEFSLRYRSAALVDLRLVAAVAIAAYLAGDRDLWKKLSDRIVLNNNLRIEEENAVREFHEAAQSHNSLIKLVNENISYNRMNLPIPKLYDSIRICV